MFIKSIWDGSPLTTSLEFSPILVKNILICVSVAFCASSRIAKLFFKVLPLINAKGAISISPDSIFLSILSVPKSSYSASYKGLRYGSTFSFMSPGKNPSFSPASTAGLDKITLSIFFSINIVTATDTAKKLFPVPAGPNDIIIAFSFKALIYSDCFSDLAITDFLGVLINCLKDFTFD